MEGWRGWLVNRVTVTFAVLAVVVIGWNLYVSRHDDGILEGRVVNEAGEPVAGAEVVLSERTLVSMTPIARTVTDANGDFRFEKHDRHALVLTAEKPDIGKSARLEVQLYFKNQNRRLAEPIVLGDQA